MTEEIIIDGVNVSECEHSFKQFDNWVGKDVVSCDCTLGFRCEPIKNHCKFYMKYLEQQLKRAEQKLDKIKANCNETLSECSCKNPIIDIDCRECTSGGRVEKAKEILQIIEGEENE